MKYVKYALFIVCCFTVIPIAIILIGLGASKNDDLEIIQD